jgi:predicted secreted hydrolase
MVIGHAAVTDLNQQVHRSADIAARDALDLAGVRREDETVVVYCRGWQARIGAEAHRLRADADRFALDLTLTPQKPPVLHGQSGYSRKGSARDRASCYYSFTRLAAAGKIHIGNRTCTVSGSAWMDHEFSTAPLEPGLVGWDWFSLQLSDRTELMLYFLRKADGTFHPASAGTFVDAAGRSTDLGAEQFSVQVLDRWKSPTSGAVYPVAWRLSVSPLHLTLKVQARVRDQEMDTRHTTGVVYWEGSVAAEGTAADRPVSGSGYAELTGYARPFDAPM